MKTIIAGSRSITEMQHVNDAAAASGFLITEVVSGMAPGVDLLGRDWAKYLGHSIQGDASHLATEREAR